MSRSGYSDSCEGWSLIRWRGAVASAIRGHGGQTFLREALATLEAMPEKKLIANDLTREDSFCMLGAIGHARGLGMSELDPEDHDAIAKKFEIPRALACEIMFENDEGTCGRETPEQRWQRMRDWLVENIKP